MYINGTWGRKQAADKSVKIEVTYYNLVISHWCRKELEPLRHLDLENDHRELLSVEVIVYLRDSISRDRLRDV